MSTSDQNPTDFPAGRAWTPSDWRAFPTSQQPVYADSEALAEAAENLRRLPPLVTSWEIERLKG